MAREPRFPSLVTGRASTTGDRRLSTAIRVAAGGAAATCAAALFLPLMLGAGGSPNGSQWDCAPAASAVQVANEQQTTPGGTAAQVTVPLNPQGQQTSVKWDAEQQ